MQLLERIISRATISSMCRIEDVDVDVDLSMQWVGVVSIVKKHTSK